MSSPPGFVIPAKSFLTPALIKRAWAELRTLSDADRISSYTLLCCGTITPMTAAQFAIECLRSEPKTPSVAVTPGEKLRVPIEEAFGATQTGMMDALDIGQIDMEKQLNDLRRIYQRHHHREQNPLTLSPIMPDYTLSEVRLFRFIINHVGGNPAFILKRWPDGSRPDLLLGDFAFTYVWNRKERTEQMRKQKIQLIKK